MQQQQSEDFVIATGRQYSVNPRYFRPTEVQTLLGDASKARECFKTYTHDE